MAARTKKIRHDEETRAKIQAAQIINRLMSGFNGKVELSQTQVSIGLGLLRKVLPDLSAADVNSVVTHNYVARMPDRAQTAEEWQKTFSPTIQ